MRILALVILVFAFAAPARAQNAVEDALQGYALYQADLTTLLNANIDSAAAMDQALERAAGHDPARVTRGWIAYGALTAAQSPAFVAGVRSRVRAASRAAVLRQLTRDPTYARRRPPGASEALQLTLNTLTADAARFGEAAQRYEAFSAGPAGAAWRQSETDRDARGQRLRALAGERRPIAPELTAGLRLAALGATPLSDPNTFGGRHFWDALGGRASPTTPSVALTVRADRAATLDRILTLAGLIIVEATQSESARVASVMDERPVRECLAMQQLEFRQCVSVAHDASEDSLCLAHHGLEAPGACFVMTAAH